MNGKIFLWIFGIVSLAVAQDSLFLQSRQSFALNLFKNAREQVDVVLSPISMDYALNVLFLGATKATLKSMRSGLEYPKRYSLKLIENNLGQLTESVGKIPGVEMVTKLYVNKTVQIMKNYTSLVKRCLNATTEPIAFVKNVPAAKAINDWIASATHNLIKDLIPSMALTNETKLLIINCIYFKGNWSIPFEKHLTFGGSFNAFNGKKISVDYMTRTGFLNFKANSKELNGAAVVSLDYKDSNGSMLFILPPKNTDIESWMGGINKVDWNVVVGSLNITNVNVTIPKFKITYLRDMTDTMNAMNMGPIFEENATFDKIFAAKYRKKSNICKIIQKAVISVDEDGTVAAAVSAIIMAPGRLTTTPVFLANRPFLFVIRSGPTVLFMGQFLGIEKAEVNLV